MAEPRRSEPASKETTPNRTGADESKLSADPKKVVALTVWVVTLSEPAVMVDKDRNLAEVATEIPSEFASRKDVRELIGRLKAAKRIRASRELRMATVDGQPARVQFGIDQPQIMGTTVSNRGRQNQVNYRPIGTTVEVRPQIDADERLVVGFDFTMTDSAKSTDVAIVEDVDGKSRFADVMMSRQVKTTVRLKNGAATLVQYDETTGYANRSGEDQIELIMLGASLTPDLE